MDLKKSLKLEKLEAAIQEGHKYQVAVDRIAAELMVEGAQLMLERYSQVPKAKHYGRSVARVPREFKRDWRQNLGFRLGVLEACLETPFSRYLQRERHRRGYS